MLSLDVRQETKEPLTDQIVAGVKRQIDERQLLPGVRLPSIRNFAETLGVSRFTVVEAYDRLVALGYLDSRRGAESTPPRLLQSRQRARRTTSATNSLSG